LKVNSFCNGFCSQNFFARLLGKSATGIYYLRKIGVVKYCAGGVLILRSLQNYFNSYLPPASRAAEIDAALNRIDCLLTVTDKVNVLNPARVLQRKIAALKFKIVLLNFFQKLLPTFEASRLLKAARQYQQLQQELITTKEELSRRIIAARLPAAIENVLIRRYVDCENWQEIKQSVYSLSYSYLLHRRGKNFFTLAQD